MLRLTLATLTTLVLAACSSTPPASTAPLAPIVTPAAAPAAAPAPAPARAAQAPAPVAPAPAAAVSNPAPAAAVASTNLPLHLDPNGALLKRPSVFFEFDQFVIRGEDQSVVELHGKYLAKAPTVKAVVEGNADERGGTEYNLALGNKRAQAVIKQLTLLGAADGQLEAISFGETKPVATGHDEESWAKNRRADIVYKK